MKYKHVKMKDGKKAEILLYNEIGVGSSTAERIALEIDYLIQFEEVDEILVRINSPGGSMTEGFGIFSSLERAKAEGITVNTDIDGMAASMAGFIAPLGQVTRMVDFGLFMVHNPSGANEEVLAKFKNSALVAMTAKTGIDRDKLDEMMTAETWMSADEALELGFIDEIIETEQNITVDAKNNSVEEITAVYMSLNKPQKEINFLQSNISMDRVTMKLGLNKNASEDVILQEVESLVSKAEGLETTNSTLKTDLADMTARAEKAEKAVEEQEKASAEILVSNAIEAGKFKEEARSAMVTMAINDPEGFKTLVDSIETPKKVVNIAQMIANTPGTGGDDSKLKDGKYDGKTYRELEKTDAKMLASLDEETKAELFKAQYGKYPSNYTPETV